MIQKMKYGAKTIRQAEIADLIAERERRNWDATRLSELAGLLKKISYVTFKRNGRTWEYELTYLGKTSGQWKRLNTKYIRKIKGEKTNAE